MKKNLSILVIDDEVLLEDLYKGFLARIGADVTFCDHPQKGWKAIDKKEYDLIITDLKMPVITGDEFISIVRASKLNAHTPIILCSAFINKLVITEITRESKIYFLTKPFDSKALLELVSKAVGVKKSDSSDNQTLNQKWLQDFSAKLSTLMAEQVEYSKIEHFELWNFESISLNLFIMKGSEHHCITLLMKLKTFLKIAGKIQGTQYIEIEPETLDVWQELLESILKGTGRVAFSKLLSQEIITMPGQESGFYKLYTSSGEIQAFLN
ncbi:MAG: response regulator [Bacteriovorax sp.]|nr:response regulator [Bacteriovorax sp.]